MIILTPASLSFFATIHMRHSPVSSKKCEAASSLSLNWIGVTGVPTSCEWGCSSPCPMIFEDYYMLNPRVKVCFKESVFVNFYYILHLLQWNQCRAHIM